MKRIFVLFSLVPVLVIIYAFNYSRSEDAKGKTLFTDHKCGTCHAVQAEGLTSKGKGPDLSKISDTIKTAWITKYITKQEKLHGKQHAIAFKGSDDDLKTLAGWIVSLNSGGNKNKKANKDQSSNDMMKIMDKMNIQMTGTKISGNADRDFAHLMIHHHQGAIVLSGFELKNGISTDIKNFAKDLSEKQKSDIEKLQKFDTADIISSTGGAENPKDMAEHQEEGTIADSNKTDNKDMTGNTEMDRTTDVTGSGKEATAEHEMMQSMKEKMDDVKQTGNVDQDYVNMMIAHHQAAIEMTESYLSKLQDEDLKDIAQDIISNNKKEIEELEKLKAK